MEKEIASKMKLIGANIRKRRMELKLELKEIAAKLNLTPQAYGNIENGKTVINFTHIYWLSKIFNIGYAEVLESGTQTSTYNTSNNHGDNYNVATGGEMTVQTDKEQLAMLSEDVLELKKELKP